MQVKPASDEPRTTPVGKHTFIPITALTANTACCLLAPGERRLFVGMLSKKLSEEEVKSMFSSYGIVQDVSILRSADGKSKGTRGRGAMCMWV